MTVGEPLPTPVEVPLVDILAKPQPQNNVEQKTTPASKKMNDNKHEKHCLLAISSLACLLLFIVLVSILFFIPLFNSGEIIAEEFPIKYDDRNIIISELQPRTVEYLTFNLSSIELAEDAVPSFYGCLHGASVEVFACIAQGEIPSFSQCENLLASDVYDYDTDDSEKTPFLNGIKLLPRCGLNVLELPEFQLCNSHENVWVSVFNADYYNSRAFEVTVNYADCTECDDSSYKCIPNPLLLGTSVFLLVLLAVLMCCASCLVICRAPSREEEEEEGEEFEESS